LLASDLHGSNAAFRKLVALTLQLKVDALVVAGDWSGKQSLLVSKRPDGSALYLDFDGTERSLPVERTKAQLEEWRDTGIYPVLVDEINERTKENVDSLAQETRALRLKQWLDYGQTKTARAGVRIPLFAIPGNDDGPEIDGALINHPWVCDLDQRVVLHDQYELLGFGYSNLTPWHTPRELSEPQIAARLESLGRNIDHWSNTIAVIHVPPFGSGLDLAPEVIADDQQPPKETGRGNIPVGSHAVRSFIENHGPLAVLSGHCHGSRGLVRIGLTTCVNAGSQYHHGNLCACLMSFRNEEMIGHQFFVH